MNTIGTINHPRSHGPGVRPLQHEDSTMTASVLRAVSADNTARTLFGASSACQNRTRDMQLIPEAMARAHLEHRRRQADTERLARRLITARRMQRRAHRASQRARRALAIAIMQ